MSIYQELNPNQFPGFRILNDWERSVLTVQAQGYLISLAGSGLLSTGEIEQILERIVFTPYDQVTVDDVKFAATTLILERTADGLPLIRLMNLSDSVN
ncbi:MAG: DUF494 family protein [Bacteroidetes bacterium]|nr:DUF494 family protein [Bacteroidota bacterium]